VSSHNPDSTASLESLPSAAQIAKAEKNTYGQILKSTALVGGSSVINIAIGIVRTKAMAVLLGPAGFGLAGLYGSIASLIQSIAGLGISSSGVRQIAEAVGSEDTERIARTAAVLRRTSILLGGLGAVLLVVFSRQTSNLTFGSDQRAVAVSVLSIAVFFNLVSAGQGALIQGLRHISDLAKMGVLSALFGTLITIPVVYFLREQGVVLSLVAVAAMSLVASCWYSRKVQLETPPMTASQGGQEAADLLKLGFAFMTSGLMTMGSAYLVRIVVLHKLGLEATEIYPRDELIQEMLDRGISSRRGIMAIHREPPYRDGSDWDARLPATNRVTDSTLIPPLFHGLTDAEQDYVIDCIEHTGAQIVRSSGSSRVSLSQSA
jgi:hypothetical protein